MWIYIKKAVFHTIFTGSEGNQVTALTNSQSK